MLKYLLSVFAVLLTITLSAQVPTDQDCLGAIPVCQEIYIQPNSYVGTGNYPNEIPLGPGCPTNCMQNGEKNDVWYIFTVQTGGLLGFNITPNNNADDYDWAVYSLNDYKCQDIYNHVGQMQVSCNWSGTSGVTGPNGNSSSNCQGASGSPYNAKIPVLEGETYVINISNYSSTQFGYTLDFTISTAEIYDDVAPALEEVYNEFVECGSTSLTFDFTEKVLCSSVQASDFGLDGPGGPYEILTVSGEACELGGEMEITFTITFEPPFYESGDYSLELVFLNFIQDLCGNHASTQTFDFTLDLNSPIADAGEDIDIPFLTSTQLDGTAEGGSGTFDFNWEPPEKLIDPTEEDPTTIALIETTEFTIHVTDNSTGCQASDEVLVTIVGGEMNVTTTADPTAVCESDQSDLSAVTSGGSGDYTYSWTSDPPGFTSNISNPTVFPDITTTYFIEVYDGYSTITDQITITVYQRPIGDAGPYQEILIGTSTTLDGTASSGTAPYAFLWEPATMINGQNDIEDPLTVILGGPQNYTLVITDDNLCQSVPSSVLINATGAELSAYPQADPQEICIGGSTTITANPSGGSENYSFTWTNNIDPDWSANGEIIDVSPAETTIYYVEVDDGFNSYSTHLIVPVNTLPVVKLMPEGYELYGVDTILVCVRDTVLLDAGNENNPPVMEYLWSNSWAGRYVVAKTNGNWFDIQDYAVTVTNPITTCVNTDNITLIFDFNLCAIGIDEEPVVERPVTIHPNPNQGIFFLNIDEDVNILEIKMLTLEGRPIFEKRFETDKTDDWRNPIDISNLSKGIYMIWLKADEQVYTLKLVKN